VPLSCNLGTLTSWNPLGHSRPVTGLLTQTCTFSANEFCRKRNKCSNCQLQCVLPIRKGGHTNIRRCGTQNCGNTETDLLDKQRFSSLHTNTRMECVPKCYLDHGFVPGSRFVLRVAYTNWACILTFLRDPLAKCRTDTPSTAQLCQPQISHCGKKFRCSQLLFRS
jgi:hypothetical protein